jgi:deoxyribose-phosphate aldolase
MGIKASGGIAGIEDGVSLMRSGATVIALRRLLIGQLERIGWKG